MTFDPDDPRLTAFALGELEGDDREAVDALLARIPEARRFVDELRETAALLAETLRGEPSPGLSIVQRIDLDARLGGRPVRRGIRRVLVAVAAGVALALGGYGVGWLTAPGARGARTGGVAGLAMLEPTADVAPEASATAPEPASGPSPVPDEAGTDAIGAGRSLATASAPADPQASPEDAAPEDAAALAGRPMAAEEGPPAADRVPLSRSTAAPGRDEAGQPARSEAVVSEAEGISPVAPRSQPARLGEATGLGMQPGEAAELLAQGMDAESTPAAPMSPEAGATTNRGSGPGGSSTGGASRMDMAPDAEVPAGPEAGPRLRRAPAEPPPPGQADFGSAGIAPPEVRAQAGQGGMGGAVEGFGLGFLPQQGAAAPPELKVAAGAVASGRTKVAKVESGNVVEVIDLPGGDVAQRFFFESPLQDVDFDASGTQLLATAADRSMSLFDVESGRLLNELQVVRGPLPEARFGRPGEVILRNLDPGAGGGGVALGAGWSRPESDPVAAIPADPGAITLEELGRWFAPDRRPEGGEAPIARIVNAPPYPYERPAGDEAVAIDARVVQAPWDERHRLVRIALVARAADVEGGDQPPPVVAEQVAAEVEFNPGRVLAYRPIGFEGRPSAAIGAEAPGNMLRAGKATTVLFEIEPDGDGRAMAREARSYRYQDVAPPAAAAASVELLTVTLSYREPGGEGRRTLERHVTDAFVPIAEAPDDVRLAAALGWLGLAIGGPAEGRGGALDGVATLVRSCDEGFLPEYRRELLGLIDRARAGDPGGAD